VTFFLSPKSRRISLRKSFSAVHSLSSPFRSDCILRALLGEIRAVRAGLAFLVKMDGRVSRFDC